MNKKLTTLIIITYLIIGYRFNQEYETIKTQNETIHVMGIKLRKFTERSYFTGCMENLNLANKGKRHDFAEVCLKNAKEYQTAIWGKQ